MKKLAGQGLDRVYQVPTSQGNDRVVSYMTSDLTSRGLDGM